MDLRNFFTRKRVHAGSSRDSEDDEDVVPTTSTSDALTSTNSETSVGRSVCSKAQKRKLYKATRWSGSRNILGYTAMILSRACSASSSRSEEMHLLQPGVHGLLGEFRIGITLLNNSRNIASQNVTEMLLSMLKWQNKERIRVSYNCNVGG